MDIQKILMKAGKTAVASYGFAYLLDNYLYQYLPEQVQQYSTDKIEPMSWAVLGATQSLTFSGVEELLKALKIKEGAAFVRSLN